MIKHHQGAIDMVDVLFKAYGAAQDDMMFKFATDVYADQSIEIESDAQDARKFRDSYEVDHL